MYHEYRTSIRSTPLHPSNVVPHLFQLCSVSSVATICSTKTTVASIFEIGIFRNTKCDDKLVDFQKLGHTHPLK